MRLAWLKFTLEFHPGLPVSHLPVAVHTGARPSKKKKEGGKEGLT